MTTFADLGLASALEKALAAEGYETPTPIQAKAIPIVAAGSDLLGIAQTGTGKTAAFALPILHRLSQNRRAPVHKGCRALILSPTRELATQIADSFRAYGRFTDLRVAVIFGGVAHRPQIQAIGAGVDILVATPGRLLDHISERNLTLGSTEIFVLDEADQMLDLGFVKPIRKIVSMLPGRRQNLFFSATMPHEIGALAAELLVEPKKVEITPAATTVERISQKVIHVEHAKKRALLVELLGDAAMSRALVFTRTKRGADRVSDHLEKAGVSAAAIHGNKSQQQRNRALASFKTGDVRVLVATDIAARGIDIDLVSHVVNYELPEVPEQYVHRIGRTARAGADGIAISLCDGEERSLLRDIERLTRQQIPHEDRRNDATLAASPKGEPRAALGEARREHRKGQYRGDGPSLADRADRPDRNGAGRNGGGRGGPARGGQRDASRGEGRGEARGEGRGEARGDYRGEARGDYRGEARGAHRGAPAGAGRGPRPEGVGDRHRDERRRDGRPGQPHGGRDRQDRNARPERRDDRDAISVVGGWSPSFDEVEISAELRAPRGGDRPERREHRGARPAGSGAGSAPRGRDGDNKHHRGGQQGQGRGRGDARPRGEHHGHGRSEHPGHGRGDAAHRGDGHRARDDGRPSRPAGNGAGGERRGHGQGPSGGGHRTGGRERASRD